MVFPYVCKVDFTTYLSVQWGYPGSPGRQALDEYNEHKFSPSRNTAKSSSVENI